ncbi:phytanoyl-CoA dioxygenase [Rudanella paleaurantiibacter]|uniref:Phytanoyl-CoA dioxygenase n=1 Tax=Rudanella paleaurantiibacter TaxID=2614655 RepID=A0A7J5U0P2_9BACT|nr:phytanoyl-CoA dioxygenase family protein [Rudanella paleaurantiibacter]KAB7731215.1 phytanoyl-CoA dioxygenase [Rudanella paleaurantiibacter]
MKELSADQIAQFVQDGFVKIEGAFSTETARQCRDLLWQATPFDPHDSTTWTQPVFRIGEMTGEPFQRAANTPILHRAFDQLIGPERWLPRTSLGSFPIRFPSRELAGDTGWHVDASFPGDDPTDYFNWRINVHSRGRALLMLFLFSDVTERDAPTRVRVGSHRDVAKILQPVGEQGLSFIELAHQLADLPDHPEVHATGPAGTVYLLHPFAIHAAQDHHGTEPKFMAQPPLHPRTDWNVFRPAQELYPVERAIVEAITA